MLSIYKTFNSNNVFFLEVTSTETLYAISFGFSYFETHINLRNLLSNADGYDENLLYGTESMDNISERSESNTNYEVYDYMSPVIKNINIEIKSNEFVCVFGDTGCGKTSLLECLLGNMIKTNNEYHGYLIVL